MRINTREFLQQVHSISMTNWERTDLINAHDKEIEAEKKKSYNKGIGLGILIAVFVNIIVGIILKK